MSESRPRPSPAMHMAASGPLTGWAHRTYGPFASAITLVGAVVMILGSLLAWTYDASYADNLTINFSPIGGQRWASAARCSSCCFVLTDSILWPVLHGVLPEGGVRASQAMSWAMLSLGVVVAIRASYVLGGLANVNTGLWLMIAGGVVATLGALGRSSNHPPPGRFKPLPAWVDFIIIGVSIGVALVLAVRALDSADEVTFLAILAVVGGGAVGLQLAGTLPRIADHHVEPLRRNGCGRVHRRDHLPLHPGDRQRLPVDRGQRGHLRGRRDRPEHRGRPGRPARPRLHRVHRRRRLLRGAVLRCRVERRSPATTSRSWPSSSAAGSWPRSSA